VYVWLCELLDSGKLIMAKSVLIVECKVIYV